MNPTSADPAKRVATSAEDATVRLPSATGLAGLKVLTLTNWNNDSYWDLAEKMEESVQRLDLLKPIRLSGTSALASFFNRLSVTWSEFYVPVVALFRRNRYDVVISWTSRAGVVYGILNRIFPSHRAAKHVAVDFHIHLRRTDIAYRFRLALLLLALPGMDICFCTSTREERIYADMFPGPARRFRFLPMSYPRFFHYPPAQKKDYIFSYGRSGRDFATLVNAARGLTAPLIILSRTFQPDGELPSNVTILRTHASESELIELIRSSRLVVLPLEHFDFSVGQIALTEVMSLGCPLVLTTNMATLEYATDGKSALFYEAGDFAGLNSRIAYLIANPEFANRMGEEARAQARECASRHVTVFLGVLGELAKA